MNKEVYTNMQTVILVILRVAIGWHFLYEGIVKLLDPNWTSLGYLMDSKGFLSGWFHSMASKPAMLNTIDQLNIWGLILTGTSLILGLVSRIGSIAGMVMLAFYYLSHPPFIGLEYLIPSEGNYLVVNKTLIEFFMLWLLFLFPTGNIIGLDRLLFRKRAKNLHSNSINV
jgi:thiosulfate dehydrogenase [quinone] large subunit